MFVPYVIGTLTRLHPSYPGYSEAIDVMTEDWDNLFILDACRADMFEDVIDIEIFDEYSAVVSQGSHSSEWTRRTFVGKTFDDTVYVSANPHTSLLADGTFHKLLEIWRDYDCSPNEIDPDRIADAAIEANDRFSGKRLVVHFMQPHGTGGLVPESKSQEEAYRRTIASMMEIILDLHEELGGKTVVTADHGELFNQGIKAMLGIDQHKARLRFPNLVCVPWGVLEGERRAIMPGEVSSTRTDRDEIKERLRELGYH